MVTRGLRWLGITGPLRWTVAPAVNGEIVAGLETLIDLGWSVQAARGEIIVRFGRPATAAEIAAATGGRVVNG